jgi:6-phosphogluconolactonase (cycloisomerase 2 family)
MTRKLSLACLGAALCTSMAFAQASRESADATTEASTTTSTSPSAWVYVVGAPLVNGNAPTTSKLYAYQAAADGKLTAIPGSPFTDGVPADTNTLSTALNGKYLFLLSEGESAVSAYKIESDGSLALSHTTDVSASVLGCESIMWDVTDHTGATFYAFGWASEGCSDWSALSFSIDKSNGQLDYLNSAGGDQTFTEWQQVPLTFLGNNKFAYGSGEVNGVQSIAGFKRNSNGSLTALNFQPAMPTPKSGTSYDLLNSVAADPNGNLAAGVIEVLHTSTGTAWGETQLAVYTADGSGKLTTTSTHDNMPETQTGGIDSMSMSPSGKLLAVSGPYGLRIFHFNGAKPITPFTDLISHPISGGGNWYACGNMSWDNDNHLYATCSGGLFVFTVTPTSFSVAPGSPYNSSGVSLSVQTLPRYE